MPTAKVSRQKLSSLRFSFTRLQSNKKGQNLITRSSAHRLSKQKENSFGINRLYCE